MQFVCIGGKVGGNVLKCCDILKYQKIAIPFSFLRHSSMALRATLLIDAISKALVFVKSKNTSLLYHNNL